MSSDSNEVNRGELLPAEQTSAEPDKNTKTVAQLMAYMRSGPLPDSREFEAYERILPGAADRILTMAEKQADHRMSIEKAVIQGNIASERNGQIAVVTVVTATLGATCYMTYLGMGAWGVAAVLAEIAGIVYAVNRIAKTNKEERSEKAEKQRELDES